MEWIFRPESGDKIELTLNRSDKISLDLSKLLGAFVSVCPFLRPLVLALRTWAKVIQLFHYEYFYFGTKEVAPFFEVHFFISFAVVRS